MKLAASSGSGPFSPRMAVGLCVAGVFSFSALVVLSTLAPELRDGQDGRAHALSRSAVGYAAVVRLLDLSGAPVAVSRREKAGGDLLVLTPDGPVDLDTMRAFGSARVLVVPPKWRVSPVVRGDKAAKAPRGWVVRRSEPMPPILPGLLPDELFPGLKVKVTPGVAQASLAPADGGSTLRTAPIQDFQTLSGEGLAPILRAADGGVVLGRSRVDAAVYVLSDPDLINTQGLKTREGVETALGVFQALRPQGAVVFDVTLNGFLRNRNLLRLALEPPFLGAVLALFAAALMAGYAAAVRFGDPAREKRALALGKAALADTSAMLVRLARREPAMATPYAVLTREAAVRATGLTQGSEAEVVAALDRLAERAGARDRFAALAEEAAKASDRASTLALSQRLHSWKTEILRDRR